jgi:replicative DNA helicase
VSDLVSLESEGELLAILVAHGRDALGPIRECIQGPDAFSPTNRPAAEVCFALAIDGEPILPATIRERAFTIGYPALANRAEEWFGQLFEQHLATFANTTVHARIVGDLARRRQLIAAADELRAAANDRQIPIPSMLGQHMDRVTGHVLQHADSAHRDFLIETVQELEQRADHDGALPGVPTDIVGLDALTDGWERGRLVVCAARPGCGKTAFGVWCGQVAASNDHEVFFASAEQPVKQLQRRRLGIETGLDIREVSRDRATWARMVSRVTAGVERLRPQPFTISQSIRNISQMRIAVQRQIALGRAPRLLVVDYLTKLQPEGRFDRNDLAVGSITGALARMAIDLDITVLLLAQLNRDSVKDGKIRRPSAADLRDSGVIEQDADQILLLWPGAPGDGENVVRPDSHARVEIIVEKNRHGPVGAVGVEWSKAVGRFRDEDRWGQHVRGAAA